jgi:uncharacterized protein (DUF488 family)
MENNQMTIEVTSATTPTLYSIGFVGKSAEELFTALEHARVRRVLDIRLRPDGQLSGFAKREHLVYFLRVIGDIEYSHVPEFAATSELFEAFTHDEIPWEEYARRFNELLLERDPAMQLSLEQLDRACLLCSDAKPDHCHRLLVGEYLQRHWPELRVEYL